MSFWEQIGNYIENRGHSREYFDVLLTFIKAPDTAIELPRILNNILQLMRHLENLRPLYFEFDVEIFPVEWSIICQEILAYPKLREIVPPERKKAKNPLQGYYKKHQVYIAIWQRPNSLNDQQSYFQLLAHCLLAISILKKRMNAQITQGIPDLKLNDFNSNINDVVVAARKVAISKNRPILESLPDLNAPPEIIFNELASGNDLFTPLRVLSAYLSEAKKPRTRKKQFTKRTPRKNKKSSPWLKLPAMRTEIRSNVDPDQDEAELAVDLFRMPTKNDVDAREWEESGCSPNETYLSKEIASTKMVKGKEKQVKSPWQKVFHLGRLKSQLSMQNQRLTSRWEVLSLYEVKTLFNSMTDLVQYKDRSKFLPPNTNPYELCIIVSVMFWFGQRIDKIDKQELRIYRHSPGVNDLKPGFVMLDDKDDCWWTRSALPDRIMELDEDQLRQAHEKTTNFSITTGYGYEKLIRIYVNKLLPDKKTEVLFPKENIIYRQMVTEFLNRVNRSTSTRLTVNRVSDYLFEMIARHEGSDLAAAMFIIGRENFLGLNPSYYTCLSIERLQNIYRNVCTLIKERISNEYNPTTQKLAEFTKISDNDSNSKMFIGSPYRPVRTTVQGLVEELKRNLNAARFEDRSILKLMRLHESMTKYTAFLINFCSGFRAVRDPFLSAAEIDWVTGFATLRDKDNEDGYNTRLVWLPPVCVKQLKLFQEHQQNALYRFNALIPDFYSKLDPPRRDGPGRRMFFATKDKDSNEYIAMSTGPKLLGAELSSVFALPFNASRHYLRSELLERDCPIEVINAFLGHYERGEEPFGRYSGLSPHAFREVLIDKLLPLLQEDGWEELPGLGAKL